MKRIVLLFFAGMLFACSEPQSTGTKQDEINTVALQRPKEKSSFCSTKRLESQSFKLNSKKNKVIYAKGGTAVDFSKAKFVNSRGEAVTDNIEIEVKEALTIADILQANLSTLSNGKLLETGGMLYVAASSNGEALELSENSSVKISVASKRIQKGMAIYEGEVDSITQEINWVRPRDEIEIVAPAKERLKQTEKEVAELENIIAQVESPSEPEVVNDLVDITIHPGLSLEDFPDLNSFENLCFKILEPNESDKLALLKDWNHSELQMGDAKDEYLLVLQQVKKYESFPKVIASHAFRVKPVFHRGQNYDKAMEGFIKRYQEYLAGIKEERERITALRQQREIILAEQERIDNAFQYVFNTKRLGWVNIDKVRVINNPAPFAVIIRDLEQYSNMSVNVVLEDRRSVLPAYWNLDQIYRIGTDFERSSKVTIVAIGEKDSIPYYCIKNFRVSKSETAHIELKQTTVEGLKKALLAEL